MGTRFLQFLGLMFRQALEFPLLIIKHGLINDEQGQQDEHHKKAGDDDAIEQGELHAGSREQIT
ncbi:hypothetical protein ACPJHQ_07035 [Rossellomorea sp. H39__3]